MRLLLFLFSIIMWPGLSFADSANDNAIQSFAKQQHIQNMQVAIIKGKNIDIKNIDCDLLQNITSL